MRRSPMRCPTNRISQSLLTESKKEATSASKISYGFRPKRGQHNALDALVVGITSRLTIEKLRS